MLDSGRFATEITGTALMNTSRLTLPAEATIYHLVTRTTRGEFLFGDLEKERMRRMVWQMAEFCGVEVLTYAVMSNHPKEENDKIAETLQMK